MNLPVDGGGVHQLGVEGHDARVALGLRLGQGFENHRLDRGAHVGRHLRQRRGLLVHDLIEDGGHRAAPESWAPGDQLVGNRGQRELVGAIGDLVEPALRLLGGHVLGRAQNGFLHGQLGGRLAHLGNAKVDHLHHLAVAAGQLHQEHVLRLEVAVDHLVAVRRRQAGGDLANDVENPLDGHGADPLDLLGQLDPFQHLHDQVGIALGRDVEIQDLHDVGVAQPGRHLGLALEALEYLGPSHDVAEQHLDRVAAGQARVRGLVHLAHPTNPNQPNHLVGIRKQGTGYKARAHVEIDGITAASCRRSP